MSFQSFFLQVDSSEWAFFQATQAAFEEVCWWAISCPSLRLSQVCEDGVWQLLEPIMTVEVNCPNEFTSQLFSLITGRLVECEDLT